VPGLSNRLLVKKFGDVTVVLWVGNKNLAAQKRFSFLLVDFQMFDVEFLE
jgi:hypothetical protein